MATKKKAAAASGKRKTGGAKPAEQSESYAKVVEQFDAAINLFNEGRHAEAQSAFDKIAGADLDEPWLAERARMYSHVCVKKLQPPVESPTTADACYQRGVILLNDGESDEAIRLLGQALEQEPSGARYLYARASAYAQKGNVDGAVGDLSRAIAQNPRVRFQAINDSDFERIREEPAFIDIIEPTPSGV